MFICFAVDAPDAINANKIGEDELSIAITLQSVDEHTGLSEKPA